MKAMMISQYGKQPLQMTEVPTPEIGDHEVLAEIHAASINPVDFKIRDGKIKLLVKYEMPLILGNDFAGVVTKVGANVTRFKVGDEVYGAHVKTKSGTFAEYIAVDEADIALKPRSLTFAEATSIPLVGLTSYQAMHDMMKVQKGQKILIHAGSGGVGTFAIQLAKQMGAYVATTASEKGTDLVKALGADHVINYKTESFTELLTNYDASYDTLGGEALHQSFQVLKKGGILVSISGLPNRRFGHEYGAGWFKTLLFTIASAKLTALEKKHQVDYRFLFMEPSGEQLETIASFIEAGQIKPVIDRIYRLKTHNKQSITQKRAERKGRLC
ncbi:LOW QUALITY PROTEIN: bifunctional protein: zinc-containing alcohol dehydrogenase [Bacillus sp. JCM 19046]|nr:LOW QUALITY PROTEIN: bifunctional protein: zinc-containing alcohol dehydrogenase [Bacillus sp. JCM 19046]